MHSSNSEEIDVFNDDLGDETESPEIFAQSISGTLGGNLTHSRSGQVLLLALWTANFSSRKFDMFPEFIVYTFCGKDNEDRVFPWMWRFLPPKTQWAYTFVMRNMGLYILEQE